MKKQNVSNDLLVLDFSRYLPGGYATQPFADWGSEVIKVEDTGQGDFCRHDPPTRHGISYYSTALCRNKQSISLNLKDEEAKEYCIKLALKADIIVESFRPGVTKRLGIDYETIKKQNPKIIYRLRTYREPSYMYYALQGCFSEWGFKPIESFEDEISALSVIGSNEDAVAIMLDSIRDVVWDSLKLIPIKEFDKPYHWIGFMYRKNYKYNSEIVSFIEHTKEVCSTVAYVEPIERRYYF